MDEARVLLVRTAAMRVCMRFGVDPGEREDIAHEVVCRFIQHSGPIQHLRGWAGSCALNLIRDRFKKLVKFTEHAPRLYRAETGDDPRAELARREMEAKVDSMLESLRPKQRQAVEQWLKKKGDGEYIHASGKERTSIHRALSVFRRRFPEAKIFLA